MDPFEAYAAAAAALAAVRNNGLAATFHSPNNAPGGTAHAAENARAATTAWQSAAHHAQQQRLEEADGAYRPTHYVTPPHHAPAFGVLGALGQGGWPAAHNVHPPRDSVLPADLLAHLAAAWGLPSPNSVPATQHPPLPPLQSQHGEQQAPHHPSHPNHQRQYESGDSDAVAGLFESLARGGYAAAEETDGDTAMADAGTLTHYASASASASAAQGEREREREHVSSMHHAFASSSAAAAAVTTTVPPLLETLPQASAATASLLQAMEAIASSQRPRAGDSFNRAGGTMTTSSAPCLLSSLLSLGNGNGADAAVAWATPPPPTVAAQPRARAQWLVRDRDSITAHEAASATLTGLAGAVLPASGHDRSVAAARKTSRGSSRSSGAAWEAEAAGEDALPGDESLEDKHMGMASQATAPKRRRNVSESRKRRHKQTEDLRRHRINATIDDVRRMLGLDERTDKAATLDHVKTLLAERSLGGAASRNASGVSNTVSDGASYTNENDDVHDNDDGRAGGVTLAADAGRAAWAAHHVDLPRLPHVAVAVMSASAPNRQVMEMNGNALAHLGYRRSDLPLPWSTLCLPDAVPVIAVLDEIARGLRGAPNATRLCLPLRTAGGQTRWGRFVFSRIAADDIDVDVSSASAGEAVGERAAAQSYQSSASVDVSTGTSDGGQTFLLAVGRFLREAPSPSPATRALPRDGSNSHLLTS